MKFDSNEEMYFSWWLDELKEIKFLFNYERGFPLYLSYPVKESFMVTYQTKKQKKNKTKIVDKHLLDGHIYTPDFIINTLQRNFFEDILGMTLYDAQCYVEVKGDYDANNMTRLFRVNQKWVYKELELMINLVKIPSLFKKTFTPARYLLTDQTMKPRKLKYKPRSLKEFLEEL